MLMKSFAIGLVIVLSIGAGLEYKRQGTLNVVAQNNAEQNSESYFGYSNPQQQQQEEQAKKEREYIQQQQRQQQLLDNIYTREVKRVQQKEEQYNK